MRPEGFEPPTHWFEARCSIRAELRTRNIRNTISNNKTLPTSSHLASRIKCLHAFYTSTPHEAKKVTFSHFLLTPHTHIRAELRTRIIRNTISNNKTLPTTSHLASIERFLDF